MSIPEGLSVVGFDNISAAPAQALTTVREDHSGKGELAAELLLAELNSEPPAPPCLLSTDS